MTSFPKDQNATLVTKNGELAKSLNSSPVVDPETHVSRVGLPNPCPATHRLYYLQIRFHHLTEERDELLASNGFKATFLHSDSDFQEKLKKAQEQLYCNQDHANVGPISVIL